MSTALLKLPLHPRRAQEKKERKKINKKTSRDNFHQIWANTPNSYKQTQYPPIKLWRKPLLWRKTWPLWCNVQVSRHLATIGRPPFFSKIGAEWERSLAFNCLIVKNDARCQYRAEQFTKIFCRASQTHCLTLLTDWWINCTTSWGRGRPIQWSRTCTRWPVCAIQGVSLTCIMNNENSCSILIVMIWIHRKARVVYPCGGKANKHVDNKGAKWNKDAVSRTAPGPGFVLPGHRRRGLPRGYADTAGTTTVRRSAAAPRWAGSGWHFDRSLSSVDLLTQLGTFNALV